MNFWKIYLIIIAFTIRIDAQQVYTFPDSVETLRVSWSHDNPIGEPVYFTVYRNGGYMAGVQDELFINVQRSWFLADTTRLWVTATDSAGNESGYRDYAVVVFLEEPPEPTVYEADADKLWMWTKTGAMSKTLDAIKLYGYDVGDNCGKLSKILLFGSGQYQVAIWGHGPRAQVSIDDDIREIVLTGESPHFIYFDVMAGDKLTAIQTVRGNDIELQKIKITSVGEEADRIPPNDPYSLDVRIGK